VVTIESKNRKCGNSSQHSSDRNHSNKFSILETIYIYIYIQYLNMNAEW
jgi:hypothetical protein